MTEKIYAFIKNQEVVNTVVFDNPSEELLNHFKTEFNLDLIVEATEKTIINGTYDGEKFWLPQPYLSWIKNQQTNEWQAPIAMPEEILHKYNWDENIVSWVLAPVPEQPYSSWLFNDSLYMWQAPIPYPTIEEGSDEIYIWDENTISWLLLPPSN